jgi:hypothetical protein
MNLLLDAPLWLIGIMALLAAGLMFNGLRSGQDSLRKSAMILFIVAIALLALKWVVPTDEKKVEHKTRELLTDIGSGKWDQVRPTLSHATMLAWQGDELTARAKDAAEHYRLSSIRVNSLDVKKEPQVLTVQVSVITRSNNPSYDVVPSSWTFEYQKRGKDWVLIRIVPIRIATFQGADIELILNNRF